MSSRGWTCRRVRCGTLNEPQKKKCVGCGGAKPKKRVPAHKKALRDYTYDDYLALNREIHFCDEVCGICLRPPRTRRLDRDHDHTTGNPRGLLCARCNQRLERGADTVEWLAAALMYVRQARDHHAQG